MSGQRTEQFRCDWCGATTAKRTGQPFTEASLRAHWIRGCPKAPATVAIGLSQEGPMSDSGKSTKSLSPTVTDALSLSSSLKKNEQPSSETAADSDEEKESVAALWAKHKFCRVENKDGYLVRVFTDNDHSYIAMGWRYGTEKQRKVYQGIVAKLRSHAEQEEWEKWYAAEVEAERLRNEQEDPYLKEIAERRRQYAIEEAAKAERMARWEANGFMDPITPEQEARIAAHDAAIYHPPSREALLDEEYQMDMRARWYEQQEEERAALAEELRQIEIGLAEAGEPSMIMDRSELLRPKKVEDTL